MANKKNIQLTDYQKRLLREYYRGKRSARHMKAFHLAERIRKAGLIADDGLLYPAEAQFATQIQGKVPKWVYVQAHRFALHAILLPEADSLLTQGKASASISRYRFFKILDIPRSGRTYRIIAPKLTEEQAVELTDLRDMGQLPLNGCTPWFPKEYANVVDKKLPYPPAELDPYFDEAFYEKHCLDYEDLTGEPVPVNWGVRWGSQLLFNRRDPAASQAHSAPETQPNPETDSIPEPDHGPLKSDGASEQAERLLEIFDDD